MSDALELETLRENDVDEAQIAQIAQAQKSRQRADNTPQIQPGNMLTVQLFNLCNRYWMRAGMEGRPQALDPLMVEQRASKLRWYQELDAADMEWLWHGLDVMANTCLEVWRDSK